MDCRTRESTLELQTLASMCHGHNGVGDARADVCSHDNGNRIFHGCDGHLTGPHQANHDRGARGGGLNQHGRNNAHHQTCHRVVHNREEVSCTFASKHKERAAHHVQSHQEHID